MVRYREVALPDDHLELDGVKPPPELQEPTVVVWRENGLRSDRIIAAAAMVPVFVLVSGLFDLKVGSITALASLIFDAVIIVILAFIWLAISNPNPYRAAGRNWLMSYTGVWSDERMKVPWERTHYWIRLDELAEVTLVAKRSNPYRKADEWVRFADTKGWGLGVELEALQASEPLMAVLEPHLRRPGVEIQAGLYERMHEPYRLTNTGAGSTVYRAGLPPPT